VDGGSGRPVVVPPAWSPGAPPQRDSLSTRDVKVLQLVARGMTNADFGPRLFISEATVKTHLLRAFGKARRPRPRRRGDHCHPARDILPPGR
jgi:hypothetical protein